MRTNTPRRGLTVWTTDVKRGGVLVIAVISAALVAACGGSASKYPVAKSVTTKPTTAQDRASAAGVIVQSADLPKGWTLVEDDPLTGKQLNSPPDACDPHGLFGKHTAGRHREWSYRLRADGIESGHLVVLAKVASTTNVVLRQLALLDSDSFHACEAGVVERNISATGAAVIGPTIWQRLDRKFSVTGVAIRFATPYRIDGRDGVMYTDNVTLGLGRVRVLISPQSCCVPPSDHLEAALIKTVTRRLQTA